MNMVSTCRTCVGFVDTVDRIPLLVVAGGGARQGEGAAFLKKRNLLSIVVLKAAGGTKIGKSLNVLKELMQVWAKYD